MDVTNREQNLQEKITLKIFDVLIKTLFFDIHHVHLSTPKSLFYCIKMYLHNPNKCLRDLPFGQGHRQCVSPFFITESTHVNPSGHLLEVISPL